MLPSVLRWSLAILLLFGFAAGGFYYWKVVQSSESANPLANVRFGETTKGPIAVNVTATGQLQPVTQVDVGTQVSGTLQEILVDFNSPVTAGQVLAKINTDNLEARIAQNRASLKRAEASLERLQVEHRNAVRQATRLKELHEQGIVPEVDLENAEIARDSLAVQIKVSGAEIEQARTTLRLSEIDLDHATITSPIQGIVIQRAVEVGQTVAASFNSPLLFQIANDLGKMQIRANIDEADIGRVQRQIRASFTVDALPGRVFDARLSQVRLNPTITSNVVIYTCIFAVTNSERDGSVGPLIPGLTANLTILVDERKDALLVPAASTRFQPKGVATTEASAGEAAASAPATARMTGSRGRERRASEGAVPGAPGGRVPNAGVVWVKDGGKLRPIAVEIGISDGTYTEIVAGELKPGDEVAIGLVQADAGASGSLNPFGSSMSGGRQGGGGMGGPGARGGGSRSGMGR